MIYKGIVKKRSLTVRIIIFILAAYMLYREIIAAQYIYIPLVVLVMAACFFDKAQVVSEEGVDIEYRIFGRIKHNYWRWDEITTIHLDYNKAGPNVMLHIGRDVVTRSFIMTRSDSDGVVALAKKMNSQIYIKCM